MREKAIMKLYKRYEMFVFNNVLNSVIYYPH